MNAPDPFSSPDQPPPGYGTPPPGYGTPPGSNDTVWALLSHLSIFVFPLLAPLVIYLVYKDTNPFVRLHAAESLNFHLTLTIAGIVSLILSLVIIGIFGLLALAIIGPVFGIIAAIKAGQGLPYRYPLTIHFVN